MARIGFFLLHLFSFLLLSLPAITFAQPATAQLSGEATKKLLEEAVERFTIVDRDDEEANPLPVEVVMRWGNNQRGAGPEQDLGRTIIWTHQGRPEAIAAIFHWSGEMKHEFSSLARDLKIEATSPEFGDVWKPEGFPKFRPLPDEIKPARTAKLRTLQLKSIARQFSATLTGWRADDSDRQELRMLPRPLKTYEVTDPQSKVKEGALFAFVQGTDPECVLALEYVEPAPDKRIWEYTFVRRTSGGLLARWKGKQVWKAPKHPRKLPTALNTTVGSPWASLQGQVLNGSN